MKTRTSTCTAGRWRLKAWGRATHPLANQRIQLKFRNVTQWQEYTEGTFPMSLEGLRLALLRVPKADSEALEKRARQNGWFDYLEEREKEQPHEDRAA